MYKTSFNGLDVFVEGVYSAYNLTQEELTDLKRTFRGKVNGSKGNYTVYRDHVRRVNITLFVHDLWIPIRFDLREDLLKLSNSDKIYTEKIKLISKELKERRICIHVDYNYCCNRWSVIEEDYIYLMKTIKEIIDEFNL